jgi:undecaprenyl-diphosphatase
MRFLLAGDHRLMRAVHRWQPPGWFRLWMMAATRAGDGWLWYAIGVLVALFGGPGRGRALGASAASAGCSIALFSRVKRLVGRRRPCHLEPHSWADLLPPDQFSFPSGHTMTALSVCVPLALFYPVLAPGLFLCAISIGMSRVVLGMHFLTDVLAGAALGSAMGYLSWTVFLRL